MNLSQLHPYQGPIKFEPHEVSLGFEQSAIHRVMRQLSTHLSCRYRDTFPLEVGACIKLLNSLLKENTNKHVFHNCEGISLLSRLISQPTSLSPSLLNCIDHLCSLPDLCTDLIFSDIPSKLSSLLTNNPNPNPNADPNLSISLAALQTLSLLLERFAVLNGKESIAKTSIYLPNLLSSSHHHATSSPSPSHATCQCVISALRAIYSVTSCLESKSFLTQPEIIGEFAEGISSLCQSKLIDKLIEIGQIDKFRYFCLNIVGDLVKFKKGYDAIIQSNVIDLIAKGLETDDVMSCLWILSYLSIKFEGAQLISKNIRVLRHLVRIKCDKRVDNDIKFEVVCDVLSSINKNDELSRVVKSLCCV
ncbi:hypothetical protein P9112_008283 [Eukaryota sp. TZLM1-RC]